MNDISKNISISDWVKLTRENDCEIPINFYLKSPSMVPVARVGTDELMAIPIVASKIKRYDIILIDSGNEELGFVAHRVVKITAGDSFITMGDANLFYDPPVTNNMVVGKIVHIQRGKWSIYPDSLPWQLYARVWYWFRIFRKPAVKAVYLIGKVRRWRKNGLN